MTSILSQTASASSLSAAALAGGRELLPALAGFNPHADQLETGPRKRGIDPVMVSGGRCVSNETPRNDNPAGIQFLSPWNGEARA